MTKETEALEEAIKAARASTFATDAGGDAPAVGEIWTFDDLLSETPLSSREIDAAVHSAVKAVLSTRPVAEALRHVLDRDRYIVAIALGHIRKALDGHRWLLEGRGPYEWDDDRYRDEFTAWVENIEASTGLLAKLAWDKADCTTDAVKVQAAREAAREYAVNAPKGHRDMLPSDIGLPCPSCASLSTLRAGRATTADALLSRAKVYMTPPRQSHYRFSGDFRDAYARYRKLRDEIDAHLTNQGGEDAD